MSVELMREGQALLPELYPDKLAQEIAAPRLYASARRLLDRDDRALWPVGFFLFGMSEAAAGRKRHA